MKFMRRKLSNGMTVIMEKRDLPVVSFCIANKFGASFEESKIKGVAHFIEHLLFTGTKTRTHEDISREIEKRGGILNAFTWHDVTNYWFKLPSEHLDVGMDILIDMLNNSVMNEEKFEKEKKVILEEIKMYHDTPQRHVIEMIEKKLYEKPFGDLVIGNAKTVSSLKRDFVFDYYKKMYVPSNYVAVVVGNADFEKVCDKLEKSFLSNVSFTYSPVRIKTKNGRAVEKRNGIDQAHLVFGLHAPAPNTREFHALQVLITYLAGGLSAELCLEIREKRGLAYAVHGDLSNEKTWGYATIYVGTKKQSVSEVKKLILEGFKKATSLSEENLEAAKERLIGLRKVSSEESSDVMNGLLFQEISSGRAEDYYGFEENIKKVTLEDVRKVAKIKKYSWAELLPSK